jgi:hypothetical protein
MKKYLIFVMFSDTVSEDDTDTWSESYISTNRRSFLVPIPVTVVGFRQMKKFVFGSAYMAIEP